MSNYPRRSIGTKILVVLGAMAGLLGLWCLFLISVVEVVKRDKLADCSSDQFEFSLSIRYLDRHRQFVIGVHSGTPQPHFKGEMEIIASTGLVARLPLNSQDVRPCSWLHARAGLDGYILGGSRTNWSTRVDDLVVKGQKYSVRVVFSELPPEGSSLWLSALGKSLER